MATNKVRTAEHFEQSLPGEQWKQVEGATRYWVSNLGRLLTTKWKGGRQTRVMKPAHDARGYLRTMLVLNGRNKTVKVHRVVGRAWIPNPQRKPQINHKNGIKDDNRAENLEWVTQSENVRHSFRTGLQSNRGSESPTSKLTEDMVREIRAKFRPRIYTREMLGEEYGVAPATIKDVVLRRSWGHVP